MTKKIDFQNSKSEQKMAKIVIFFYKVDFFVIFGLGIPKKFLTIFFDVIYCQKKFFFEKTKNDKKIEFENSKSEQQNDKKW